MKCQKCNQKEATVLIRQTLNGKDYEYKLCGDCATTLGFNNNFDFNPDFVFANSLFTPGIFSKFSPSGKIGNVIGPGFSDDRDSVKKCESCQMTIDDIRRNGRVGCSKCYETFEDQMVQIFRRIQSGERHRGRKKAQPADKYEVMVLKDEVLALQDKIKEAVKIEDYESAAKYKSQIINNEKKILLLQEEE